MVRAEKEDLKLNVIFSSTLDNKFYSVLSRYQINCIISFHVSEIKHALFIEIKQAFS